MQSDAFAKTEGASGEAAIDSRIDEACSREHMGKSKTIFEIFYEILYEILFRTMRLPSARAQEQIALSKFSEHACLLCAMSEPRVQYRYWNRDMQLALCKARPSRGHAYLDFQ